jgi:hypothetical protein
VPSRRLFRAGALVGLLAVAALVPTGTVQAASTIVECGQLSGYTAPDPAGPTDGSVQLGLLSPWTINADATISANAASVLPTAVNDGPTCLDLDLDDSGNVTALDFSPTGTITGHVSYDSGSGFYLFADRLIVPDFITDTYPGLAALVVTSYQAGTTLTMQFTVDTTTGAFTGFDGSGSFCGRGRMTSGGGGKVGNAIIPAAVLDATDIRRLETAGTRHTCASVQSIGTISGEGAIDITTDVDIAVAAAGATVTPPPTSTAPEDRPAPASSQPALVWLGIVFLIAAFVLTLRTRRQPRP